MYTHDLTWIKEKLFPFLLISYVKKERQNEMKYKKNIFFSSVRYEKNDMMKKWKRE